VYSGQCTRARTLLGLRGPRAVGTFRTGEDSARSKDENVTVRELLLELACETGDLSGMALRRD